MESRSPLRNGCQPKKIKMCVSVVFLAVVIGSVLLAYKAFGDKPKDPSLKKVFIVFRHGDRNPTETYPNDPYLNYSWPGGWGALTKKGMAQMYGLGKWLREEFGHLTNHKYAPAATMVNSSYSDRCQESAQAFLAGFFEQSAEEAFAEGLPWRPIPVHYLPRSLDKVLVVGKPCPRLASALAEAYKNESANSDDELKPYYEKLARVTGQPVRTVTDVEFIYNTLEIEVMKGLELPAAIKSFYEDPKMRELASRSYTLFTSNDLQRRLRGGPLLRDILNHMRNDAGQQKIFLYATHDVNLINTLRAMGFTREHYEFYKLDLGATLIFELRDAHAGREVKISMVKSADSRSYEELKISGCNGPCQLDDLATVWKEVLPDDWESECSENSV